MNIYNFFVKVLNIQKICNTIQMFDKEIIKIGVELYEIKRFKTKNYRKSIRGI